MINLHQGDCLEVMKTLDDNSVDSIVTDPPYGLSFMGKSWDYDVPGVEIWQEALRVLKPGGHALIACGTRTQHRMAVNIEDAGFEIRDVVSWIYGSGFPKSHNIGKAVDKIQGNEREEYLAPIAKPDSDCWGIPNNNSTGRVKNPSSYNVKTENIAIKGGMRKHTKGTSEWEGWGTALKPACEFWTLARKPLSEKTIANNVLEWGTGGINIDGCRVPAEPELAKNWDRKQSAKAKDNISGDMGLKDIDLRDRVPTGRFPANFIHDGSDEVVGLFPESKGKIGMTGKTGKDNNIYGKYPHQENREVGVSDSGSAARFFYCAKASKRERNAGLEGMEEKEKFTAGNYSQSPTCETCKLTLNGTNDHSKCSGEVYYKEMASKQTKNNHPTVKPIALMEYLIRLITPPLGICLDPFMGSGTTGIASKNLKFNFIGIELDQEYFKIAENRINNS